MVTLPLLLYLLGVRGCLEGIDENFPQKEPYIKFWELIACRRSGTLAVSLLSVVLLSACTSSSSLSRSDTRDCRVIPSEQAARAFDQLLNEQWQYELAHSPEFASIIGDKRYNDRWSDYSSAAVAADRQATVGFLAKFQKVNAAALDGQRQLGLILMQRQLQDHLESNPAEVARDAVRACWRCSFGTCQ